METPLDFVNNSNVLIYGGNNGTNDIDVNFFFFHRLVSGKWWGRAGKGLKH